MALSNDVISKFAKLVTPKVNTRKESIVYGSAVAGSDENNAYVKIDGSDLWTPAITSSTIKTTDKNNGERVAVVIKDHSAVILGNTTIPAARSDDMTSVTTRVDNYDSVLAHTVTTEELYAVNASIGNLIAITGQFENLSAETATIENLQATIVNTERLNATDIAAINATLTNLKVAIGEFEELSAEQIDVVNAEIDNLMAQTAQFTYVSTEILDAQRADINDLYASKLSAENADLEYVNIDFTNINKAQMNEFYAKSGLIEYITTSGSTVTGELVGVTISGDLIKGNTIMADKLVIKGNDGIYYKLNYESGALAGQALAERKYYKVILDSDTNIYSTTEEEIEEIEGNIVDGAYTSTGEQVYAYIDNLGNESYFYIIDIYPDWAYETLHGSNITANSITAEKISVTDLIAFNATVGGFHIGNSAIYSGVKSTIENSTRGIYQDIEGQFFVGDANNHIKFYRESTTCYVVTYNSTTGTYTTTNITTNITEGSPIQNAYTNGGDLVYLHVADDGTKTYFCKKGIYKLDISADSVLFGSGSKKSAEDLASLTEHVKISTYKDPVTGNTEPCIELSEGDTNFKQVITNQKTMFMNGTDVRTRFDTDGISTDNLTVDGEFRQQGFVWAVRDNGNYGLMWKGVNS